ncbi:MAG: hypothetical protein ABL888_16160 [Pirellulaceae bacterium]
MSTVEQQEYENLWHAVFANLLDRSGNSVSVWMNECGQHLLADESVMCHEYPWHWIVPVVAQHYGEAERVLDQETARQFRTKLEKELHKAFFQRELKQVNWKELDERLRDIAASYIL